MKRLSSILFLTIFLISIVSCTISQDPSQNIWQEPQVQEILENAESNEGVIIFKIPTVKSLDTAWASNNSDTYAVYAYNNSTIISGYAFTDQTDSIAIAVPEGTYNVFALAGKKNQSDNPNNGILLLGSGKVTEPVDVVAGQATTVTITLTPVELQISAPDIVDTGSTFEVVVTGSYGIDILDDNGFTLRTTFDAPTDMTNNFSSPIYPIVNPNKSFNSGANFMRTFEVTAPINTDNGTDWTVWFCTNQITLDDGIYNDRTLNDNGLEWCFVWSHINPAYRIVNFPGLTTYKTITLQQADNLNINLSW